MESRESTLVKVLIIKVSKLKKLHGAKMKDAKTNGI
jgi:hypothetical protein